MKHTLFALIGIAVLLPSFVSAADGELFISPSNGTYQIGDEFEVHVRADTDGERINAAEADVSFNPAALMVTKISTEGSILGLWPTPPEYSNVKGTIRFSGTATESYSGVEGELITIRFMALGNLPGDVRIESGAIIANDARASNIVTNMRSALYTITPRQAAPNDIPVETSTTSDPSVEMQPEVKGVSLTVPHIAGYDDVVSIGERIVLQGSGAPDSRIAVLLQFENDAPKESTVLTTRDGSFTYVSSEPAEEGVYRAWAEAREGAEVFASAKVIVTAKREGYLAAAVAAAPLMSLVLPYLLLLIAAGCSLGYMYNRRIRSTAGASE